jgi:hypothetical protein
MIQLADTVLDEPPRRTTTPNPYTTLLLSERGFSYAAYRRSKEWAKKRDAALERADHRCQVCNSPHELEVHHRTYENLCAEKPSDLTVLCATCHGIFHHGGRVLGLYVEESEGVVT